jgi:hypothetical protein
MQQGGLGRHRGQRLAQEQQARDKQRLQPLQPPVDAIAKGGQDKGRKVRSILGDQRPPL